MLRISVLTLAMTLIAAVLYADPANAQASRTWVSGVGDDANPCSRTAPCKTFAGAISKTAAGGEINCTDAGGFGAVTITKSITIDCEYIPAGIVVSGTNAIVVNAGAAAVVTLRGLDFEGLGTGLVGINALGVGALHVEKCSIRNFKAGAAFGIAFTPGAGDNGQLFVEDTVISGNGTGATGGGIQIKPTGTGTANVTLTRVSLEGNVAGFVADSTGGTGGISSAVKDSVASGNTADGWLATGGARNFLYIDRSFGTNNGGTGAKANGSASVGVVINNSVFGGNQFGLAFAAGGVLFSTKTNVITGNFTSDGAPSNFITLN
jgi:hypothetical protein